jgi:hypothetical protein
MRAIFVPPTHFRCGSEVAISSRAAPVTFCRSASEYRHGATEHGNIIEGGKGWLLGTGFSMWKTEPWACSTAMVPMADGTGCTHNGLVEACVSDD